MTPDRVWAVFVTVWIMFGLVGVVLFGICKNAAFKRRYFSWHVALFSVFMLVSVLAVGYPWQFVVLLIPLLALIAYINVRSTYFCAACGRTIIQRMGVPQLARRTSCQCGAPIEPAQRARDAARAAQQ